MDHPKIYHSLKFGIITKKVLSYFGHLVENGSYLSYFFPRNSAPPTEKSFNDPEMLSITGCLAMSSISIYIKRAKIVSHLHCLTSKRRAMNTRPLAMEGKTLTRIQIRHSSYQAKMDDLTPVFCPDCRASPHGCILDSTNLIAVDF